MALSVKTKGLIYVLLSAICFSIAGVLIKLVPWHPMSISGARCIFGMLPVYIYLRSTGRRFHINKEILGGAVLNFLMMSTFVIANKLTTAANTIVLQFTEPMWVILLAWLIFRNRPRRSAVITCFVIFAGIACFFFDKLSPGDPLGDLIAILSGIAYAGVFLLKQSPKCDFECAAIVGFGMCFIAGIPFYTYEPMITPEIIVALILLGVVQLGLAYVFLSKGLDVISPVTASLTSTIEPILNPILVAIFLGEMIGPLSIFGAVLVIGAATAYNIYAELVPKE